MTGFIGAERLVAAFVTTTSSLFWKIFAKIRITVANLAVSFVFFILHLRFQGFLFHFFFLLLRCFNNLSQRVRFHFTIAGVPFGFGVAILGLVFVYAFQLAPSVLLLGCLLLSLFLNLGHLVRGLALCTGVTGLPLTQRAPCLVNDRSTTGFFFGLAFAALRRLE